MAGHHHPVHSSLQWEQEEQEQEEQNLMRAVRDPDKLQGLQMINNVDKEVLMR